MANAYHAELHTFSLVELDKLVAIYVLKRKRDIVDADVEIGLQEPFSMVRKYQPTRSMDDAMEAAKAIKLFDRYALHRGMGSFTQEQHWFVSEIDQRGALRGFIAAKAESMAVTLACLKMAGVEIPDDIAKIADKIEI